MCQQTFRSLNIRSNIGARGSNSGRYFGQKRGHSMHSRKIKITVAATVGAALALFLSGCGTSPYSGGVEDYHGWSYGQAATNTVEAALQQ